MGRFALFVFSLILILMITPSISMTIDKARKFLDEMEKDED